MNRCVGILNGIENKCQRKGIYVNKNESLLKEELNYHVPLWTIPYFKGRNKNRWMSKFVILNLNWNSRPVDISMWCGASKISIILVSSVNIRSWRRYHWYLLLIIIGIVIPFDLKKYSQLLACRENATKWILLNLLAVYAIFSKIANNASA